MSQNYSQSYYIFICAVVSLAGILYGFDTAVISGALSPLIDTFQLEGRPSMLGWTVSSVLLGSVIGASLSGFSDRFGRKNILILAGILFSVSAIWSSLSGNLTTFICARLLGGLGVGLAAMTAPLYISEISPPSKRGAMVSLYQFAITLGVLVAYFTNDFFRNLASRVQYDPSSFGHWYMSDVWRIMLGSEIIPALIFTLCIVFVPRSPRFLMTLGLSDRARKILSRFNPKEEAEKAFVEIQESLDTEPGSIRDMFSPSLKKATFIALFLSVISQFSGIDIILHYGPLILERGGFSFADSLNGQILFGVVLVIFTTFAIWKIDQYGRRKMLLIGNIGVFISLIAIGFCYWSTTLPPAFLLFFISLFIASFAFSLGPIPWIIMAEIFPTKIRGRAMAIATLVLFGANWLIAQLFPILSDTFGEHGTFWILAVFCIPTFYFVRYVLPETKGRSLEDISSSW